MAKNQTNVSQKHYCQAKELKVNVIEEQISITQKVRKSMIIQDKYLIQTISSLRQSKSVCIILCNYYKLFYDLAFLWFHVNETDLRVLMGTHLSRSGMFILSRVSAFNPRQTIKPFQLDHSQSHVLARYSGLNKNNPHRLRECLTTRSHVGGAVWVGLAGMALLQDVCH